LFPYFALCSGIFPELGGGSGIGIGKTKAEDLITSFGGKVTGSISGKTDYLLVGKEPGMSKVKKANAQNVTRLNLDDLKNLCEGSSADDIKSIEITSFSKGFGGKNGLALEASAAELIEAAAAVQEPAQPMITNEEAGKDAKKPAAKTSKSKAEAKKPAAKKGGPTKKQLKADAKAAAAKKAAEEKAERKAKLAKINKIRSTPIEDLDWQTHLEEGDLVSFTNDIFVCAIFRTKNSFLVNSHRLSSLTMLSFLGQRECRVPQKDSQARVSEDQRQQSRASRPPP